MKVALVTGATSGIGFTTARVLAGEGWWVAATGRDGERGAAIASELGDRGTFIATDLVAADAPTRLVDHVLAHRRRLDLLVNNAGIYSRASVAELGAADLDAILALNLRAAILLAGAAVRAMRERDGGVIVNVSSEAGIAAIPGQVAYNVSKAALNMLTRSIAVDHAADGVRAVSVCPGTTRTPLVDAAIAAADDPAAHERSLAATRPAGRLGDPEEIAHAIAYAAGDRAAYMTGAELVIDGGYTAA
jgi:NAD(P)-dependent dehydrogenase (short-subunit alcohol dehydrogenase family)